MGWVRYGDFSFFGDPCCKKLNYRTQGTTGSDCHDDFFQRGSPETEKSPYFANCEDLSNRCVITVKYEGTVFENKCIVLEPSDIWHIPEQKAPKTGC